MKYKFLLSASLLLTLTIHTAVAQNKTRAQQEDDIREVVLRYLAPDSKVSSSGAYAFKPRRYPKLKAYYFQVEKKGGWTDPSSQLLERFAQHNPPVKRGSEAYRNSNARDISKISIQDKKTRAPGVLFTLWNIEWLSQNEVNVVGSYFAGGKNFDQRRFWLRSEHGRWTIFGKSLIIGEY